jgi:suppressor of G2 allele of SKP1
MTRYEWYQTSTHVVLTIFAKQMKKEDVQLEAAAEYIAVRMRLTPKESYALNLELANQISTADIDVKIMAAKVEIHLKKQNEGTMWSSLEKQDGLKATYTESHATSSTMRPSYPSSSKHCQDWDALEKQMLQEEELEAKPQGDAAINEFFRNLYENGSDEVKRAMNKSFQESSGTCLSTNWEDVSKKPVKPYKNSS